MLGGLVRTDVYHLVTLAMFMAVVALVAVAGSLGIITPMH